ncbi:glycosyltransferase family 39 protein [Actinospica durhamensis]|uniref:Glycosyltransferase family 39 protein n=1 Tax=Actinospica durhamensis TaxID=1508375 RepID=A0A941ETP9_9ACTN|nr:glycosyltransferase family 39 protein [Actinospica durhamensis]MBR7836242.1 glycosyltransferase family 39 protein [Actinospica durhamensis]
MTANVLHEDRTEQPEPPSPDAHGGRTIAGEPLRRFLLVALGLAAVAMTMVFIAVARAPQLSITDEGPHADYAYRASTLQMPAKGTLIAPEIRYEWYCHDLSGTTGKSDCTGYTSSFKAGQQDYTFDDPPLYYTTTGLLARAISVVVPGSHHFITIGRAIGAIWLFLAMMVFYLALRRFRAAWQYAAAGAVFLPLVPGVLASCTQITSDAPAALCGAAALYVLARYLIDKKTGWVLPLVVTVLSSATKTLNGMPILIVAAVLGFVAIVAARKRDWTAVRRAALVAGVIVASFGAVYLAWTHWQAGRGVANWVNPNKANGQALTGSKAGDMLSNLFNTFQHLATMYQLQPQINGETVVIWATLLTVLFCAAPLMLMTASKSYSWGWLLGLATFVGVSAIAIVVELQVFAANHEYFVMVSARYALAFIPWVVACLAVVASRRRLLRTSTGFVAIGFAVMILAELGLFTLGPALISNTTLLVG